MKKIVILGLLLLSLANVFCIDNAKRWTKKYEAVTDVKGKRKVVQEIAEVAEKGFEPLIIKILEEQVNVGVPSYFARTEHELWIKYTAYIAGFLEVKEAAPLLKRLYVESKIKNPTTKGEILFAIGKIKDPGYIEWLNLLMEDFNTIQRRGDIKSNEDTVYGLLKALEIYSDPSSFPSIFYVSLPNYNEDMRGLGQEILKKISDDPASLCEKIVGVELDKQIVLEAMRYGYYSNSSDESKISMLIEAIDTTLDNMIGVDTFNTELMRITVNEGVKFLGELKANSKEAIAIIDKKWSRDIKLKVVSMTDTVTLLNNIEALQTIGGNDAALVLQKNLSLYVNKKIEGAKTGYGEQEGPKIVIAIIRALGKSGAKIDEVIFELDRVADNERAFGNIIRNEAKNALKLLGF